MIFSVPSLCCAAEQLFTTGAPPLTLERGPWLLCVNSGKVTVDADRAKPLLAGSGFLVLAPAGTHLAPAGCTELAGIRFSGAAAEPLNTALRVPLVQDGSSLPGAAQAVTRLAQGTANAVEVFALLCRLERFGEEPNRLSPLAAQAVTAILGNYANLYGVEELAQTLGVSKSHLVRSFKAALGTTPGAYLTEVRLEAARQLLGSTDCSLELIAQMCGFSGANYFVRVFREKTGGTPAQFRAARQLSAAPRLVKSDIYL